MRQRKQVDQICQLVAQRLELFNGQHDKFNAPVFFRQLGCGSITLWRLIPT